MREFFADFNSDQVAKRASQTAAGTPLDPTELHGRVRVLHFSWTGDAAQNDRVFLGTLPNGARVLGGRIDFTDFGTAVTLDIGTTAAEAKYAAALDVATAAGQLDFANTVALSGMLTAALTADEDVYAKFEAANPDAGTIDGYIQYVLD